MEMITKETKERFQGKMGAEYRVNKQAVENKPATKSPEQIKKMLFWEAYAMALLLLCEVNEWEELFWNRFKAFLDQIGNDRVEEKERLTREWRANCWRRLKAQMHAAEKNLLGDEHRRYLEAFRERCALSIRQFVEGDEIPKSISLSELRKEIVEKGAIDGWANLDDEIRLRMEKEIEDTEFRLKRGSVLGQFDQFWDDDTLFKCRYSRSKWLHIDRRYIRAPLEIYSHALKGNKNIIHIAFTRFDSDDVNWLQATIRDLPWVTSISFQPQPTELPSIHHDPLFIKSNNNDLITFAKEIQLKLDPFSTYIFVDAGFFDIYSMGRLTGYVNIFISFIAPTSGQSLILRLEHSGREDGHPIEVTLGSTIIQLNPSSKSSLTIDDITLHPIQDPGPSESDHLSFEPEIRNDIVIRFGGIERYRHFLHDIELLDEAGLKYRRNRLGSIKSPLKTNETGKKQAFFIHTV